MNEKYLKLSRLYNDTLPRICSSAQEYNRFLRSAAFNYRLSFNNAVAAYAQNVGTDLLLSYNQWQLYGRVPRRYSKQILLFDNANRGRYSTAYMYSATVEDKRVTSHKEINFFTYENNEAVLNAVQNIYQTDEASLQRILYNEVRERFEAFVTDDFLAVDNAADFLSKSVVNMLLSRFGEEMPYTALPPSISAEQLQTAFGAAMNVFRAEYAELAVSIPVELEKQRQEQANHVQDAYSDYYPLAQEYFRTKDNYPDAMLLIRVGDFYEALGSDALTMAKELEFTLTSRTVTEEKRVPMCGFPTFRTDDYIDKLNEKGLTVGVMTRDENGGYQVELREPVAAEKTVESVPAEPEKPSENIKVEPDIPKAYQVITNAGDDGGFDEKAEYATVDEAIRIGKQYLADGYLGFSIYNRETKAIEHTEGEFNVERAYSDDVLRINGLAALSVTDENLNTEEGFKREYYDRTHEDKSLPFLSGEKNINAILLSTPYLKASKKEIADFFETERDDQKRTDFIKSIFNDDITEIIIPDGRRMGYKTFQNVLHFWSGSYDDRTAQSFYDWGVVAGHFNGLRLIGELRDDLTQDEQLQLIQGFAGEKKPAFVFSQELIDAVLTRGSGISQGKMRIYDRYQKPSTASERIKFLKDEYGWGGVGPVIAGTGIDENHDSKGIHLHRGFSENASKISLKWSQVEQRIGELIKSDQYLTPKEKELYPKWLEREEARKNGVRIDAEGLPPIIEPESIEPKEPVTETSESAPAAELKDSFNDKLWQNYSQAKSESPDRVVIYHIDNYFEIMGTDAERIAAEFEVDFGKRILSNGESVSVFGYPAQQSPLFADMLMDRGHDLAFIREENGELKQFYLNSDSKENPVDSHFIAKVEYLDRTGKVDSTLEYTSEYRLKKDILDETDVGYGMNVYLYKDKNGSVIDHEYLNKNKSIRSLEILDYAPPQTEQTILLEKAKQLINEFCIKEYDSNGADFSDLTAVNIAYTTTEDELHEIQADVNLVDFQINTKVDGKVVRTEQYESLQDIIDNGLDGMTFDDLVYLSDEELAPFYEPDDDVAEVVHTPYSNPPIAFIDHYYVVDDLTAPEQDGAVIPPEKPTVTLTQQEIDRLLLQDPALKESKLRIYAAFKEGLGEKSIIRILQREYSDIGGLMCSNEKSFLRNSNSEGVYIGDIGGDYLPTVITFEQIYQRIGELIADNRYLNERELEEYNSIDPDENSVIDFYDVRFSYKLGDAAILNGKPYIISALSDTGVMAYPEDTPLFVEKFPRPLFEEMLSVNAADNKHLIVRGTITYDIYQLGETDDAQKMMFRSLENIHNQGLTINHADYEKVYSGEIKRGETLEDIYEKFNVHHPEDFTGHSLSTSDVVVIHQFGNDRAFFCDSIGFPEIQGFFEQKVIEEPEASTVIEAPVEDVVEVIYSPAGIPTEEETVSIEELTKDEPDADNFMISDDNIGVGTPSQRYQNNVNAIKTLHVLQAENRLPTVSEQKVLSQYVGWGGLSDNLRPGSTHYQELRELLSLEEYRAACDSALTAFYTPPVVVKSIYKTLNRLGFTNGTVLESKTQNLIQINDCPLRGVA